MCALGGLVPMLRGKPINAADSTQHVVLYGALRVSIHQLQAGKGSQRCGVWYLGSCRACCGAQALGHGPMQLLTRAAQVLLQRELYQHACKWLQQLQLFRCSWCWGQAHCLFTQAHAAWLSLTVHDTWHSSSRPGCSSPTQQVHAKACHSGPGLRPCSLTCSPLPGNAPHQTRAAGGWKGRGSLCVVAQLRVLRCVASTPIRLGCTSFSPPRTAVVPVHAKSRLKKTPSHLCLAHL